MNPDELANINFIFSDEEIKKHYDDINSQFETEDIINTDVINSSPQLSLFDI
jgi:hypothetical protein